MILNDASAIEESAVYTDKKWPNAVIPFEISDEYSKNILFIFEWNLHYIYLKIIYLASDEKQVIQNAMNDFQSKSCIKFTHRSNEEDYVYIWKKPNTGYD